MCRTTYFSLQSSNYRRMNIHRASESVHCTTKCAVNGLSCLAKLRTSKGAGTADSIRKFSNRTIPFEPNRIGRPIRIRIESRSFAGPYSQWLCHDDITLTIIIF